jgi:hypothetical protein
MDRHKKVWAHSFANEIGRLFQGIRNVLGTDTCFFIPKSLIPAHKHPTYRCICSNYRPQKEEKHCIRLTIGGDWINYPGNNSTPMADLTTAKLLINSTISTPGTSPISTSTPPCQTPSTCDSVLTSSLTKSSSITTFGTLSLLTAGSTSRFRRECMVFPKPASLQINYSKKALPPKNITNANIHLVSGAMSGETSCSA